MDMEKRGVRQFGQFGAVVACGEAGDAPCGMPSRLERSESRRTASDGASSAGHLRSTPKKAQVSIFMILAALLLLGGILWFTLLDVSEQEVEFIPKDIKPVHEYITACLYDASEQAMRRMGQQSGYIDIPLHIDSNPAAYLAYAPYIRNPYWWHDGVEAIPSLEFIQQETEREAQKRVVECLDNLSVFRMQYITDILSQPKVEIIFGEEDTKAVLHYALALQTAHNGTRHELEQFAVKLPIQFKRIYNLSVTLLQSANRDYFFERKALDVMSMVPQDIPLTEIDMSCDTKRWSVDTVKRRLQELLQRNIPFIKIAGTSFSTGQYVPNPFEQGDKQTFANSYFNYHYIWDLGVKDWQGLRVGFEYDPAWPTPFTVRPSDNGIMESNAMEGARELSFLCMQIAHFTYDVQFPVRVSIVDDSSPTQPYIFSFAFENYIDHNQPSRELIAKELIEPVDDISSMEYCSQRQHPVTVYTVINTTGEFVKGINLTFICGRFSCPIGHTDWLSFGAAAGISKEFPRCTNGIIRGSGAGFLSSEKFLPVTRDDQTVFLSIVPVKGVKAKVVKHNFFTLAQEELLSASERAIITLTAKDTTFESSTFFTQDNTDSEPLLQLMADGPHLYKVSVLLIRGESVVGGYQGEWKVDGMQLGSSKNVLFHAIESGFAAETDSAVFIQELASHSKNVPQPQLG
jgi:hypothetical protein